MTNSRTNQTVPLTQYSFGTEEFSMILTMMGNHDDGGKFLAFTHENLEKLDMDALLSSASHSLLARGYCKISPDGKKVTLERNFEKSVSPLVKYDHVMFLNLMTDTGLISMNIFANVSRGFCAHLNKAGLVHMLDCGSYNKLSDYLIGLVVDLVVPSNSPPGSFESTITLDVFPGSLVVENVSSAILSSLSKSGWPKEETEMLNDDFAHQRMRGMISKIQTDDIHSVDQKVMTAMFLLSGPTRAWLFSFSSLEPQSSGMARLIDQTQFKQFLIDFCK